MKLQHNIQILNTWYIDISAMKLVKFSHWPSKLQVSVEYGLCEMMSELAIRPDVAPKDGNWGFDISEREAMLPAGTVDNNVERVYKEV